MEGVHRLGTWMVNWYLLEQDGRLTVVDSGVPRYRPQLDEALATLGRSLDDIEAVVLTHAHADHIGLAEQLRREAGARVLIHGPDEQMARTGKADKKDRGMLPYLRHRMAWRLLWHLVRTGGTRIPVVEELETYADGDVLDVPGRPRVVATPGHTQGHVAYHLEQRGLVFAGDAMCSLNPFTGRRGPQLMPSGLNNSSEQALSSLSRIEALDADTLLFGHGEPWMEGAASAVARAREAGPT